MLNFKSYQEAEEFHKSNYPIQTRSVLIEKHSELILERKHNRFCKDIMYKPSLSLYEQEIIFNNRKEHLSKFLINFNSHLKNISFLSDPYAIFSNTPSSEYVIEEQEKNKHLKKDDLNSMWLDICELF